MKIGFFGINVGACAEPVVLERVARTAEAAGYESLWTGEHIVLPDPHQAPSPSPPETPFLDSAVALTFAAAHTARVKLGTGIVILPQRNPLVLAKEMVSVDVLSNGRLILGVASGYLHQEFAALGVPFSGRGPRTDEYIDAIREMWTAEKPKFEGRYVKFAEVNAQPRPIQRPTPPFVIGGQSAPAYRRALERGHGVRACAIFPVDFAENFRGRPARAGAVQNRTQGGWPGCRRAVAHVAGPVGSGGFSSRASR